MANKISIKSVFDLLGNHFIIPSYQRGYRWTFQQVNDLLDDIWEFTRKEKKKGEYYCLQPVIVSPCEIGYFVIDGQQRLTTIYIILEVLKELKNHITENNFTLEYETRKDSERFLANIDLSRQDENIDYFHICKAYETVNDWFEKRNGAVKLDILNSLLRDDERGHNVKVIWYEVDSSVDQIEIFTRINMGKIPLTNSELVRALFLKKDNFDYGSVGIRLAQLELATEWDNIEHRLGDSEFWYFLKDNQEKFDNRIEFIFNLIAGTSITDGYHTFRYFNEELKKSTNVENVWQQIKKYYLTFSEWFEIREYYHLIGYLIALGEKIKNLEGYSSTKTKTEFKELLKKKITEHVQCNIDELNYEDDSPKIRKVLLLFNIATLLSNSGSNARFQFERYKNESWDIEHIHSVQSEMPEAATHIKDWLEQVEGFSENEELKAKISEYLNTKHSVDDDVFSLLYNEILSFYSERGVIENVDAISNLTLLDSGTNRGYKNAIFPIKRQKIIEKDTYGTFIPICTKNVFMKYYTQKVDQMTFWGKEDRKDYFETMKRVLSPYISGDESREHRER
ncbi:DUF262 domain-containing protein [Chloroflexota bacterium]